MDYKRQGSSRLQVSSWEDWPLVESWSACDDIKFVPMLFSSKTSHNYTCL